MRIKEKFWHADDADAKQRGLKISENQRLKIRFIRVPKKNGTRMTLMQATQIRTDIKNRVQKKALKYNLYKP